MENNKTVTCYRIEWNYTPKDIFEEAVIFAVDGYCCTFDNGIVSVEIPSTLSDEDVAKLGELLGLKIKKMIEAAGLYEHTSVTLGGRSSSKTFSDGSRSTVTYVESLTGTLTIGPGRVDTVKRDSDGNVIFDSRQDRIDRRKGFVNLLWRNFFDDPILQRMLRSYQKAISDPDDEFIHLYEIKETAKAVFGSDDATKKKLSISRSDWNKFTELTNNAPVLQGRHRGKHLGQLRMATQEELQFARQFAKEIMEKYVLHLSVCGKISSKP